MLVGCAGYQNVKGKAEIAFDQPDEGVRSLASAAKLDPSSAGFQIDHLTNRDRFAMEFVAHADELRAGGKIEEARNAYERVLRLDGNNARASQGLAALQQDARLDKWLIEGERLLGQGKIDQALDRALLVLDSSPRNRRAAKLKEQALDARTDQQIAVERSRSAEAVLDSRVTLQLRDAPLRSAFEALSKSANVNFIFDRDVRQDSRVTIFVRDVSLADAIDLILMQNQLDKRAMNANTIMVYPAIAAKQAEYEDLVIRSFRVTNADLKYVTGLLKSMLRIREVSADERTGVLVMRDTAERLRLAEKLIALHDAPEPEIMLEVQVLEVTTSRNSNLGVQPPGGITISTPGSTGTLTWGELKNLSRTDLVVSPLSATINFRLEDGSARLLASPRIRAKNREKAKIMIGDRVPTITNTVTPVATGAAVVTGTVTYQDVGLKLEFESQVYGNNDVGIKISLEVSNIAQAFSDAQGSRSYQIGTRNASTTLRLKDGETQILGGLISDQDRNTATLIPGLGHLPVVGRLFGNNDGSDSRSEIVLAITPRVLREIQPHGPDARSIFSGTANVIRERPILGEAIPELRGVGTIGATGAVTGSQGAAPTRPTAPAADSARPAVVAPAGAPSVVVPQAPAAQSPAAGLPPPPPRVNRRGTPQ